MTQMKSRRIINGHKTPDGTELFPFSVSHRGGNTFRIFDGDSERLIELNVASSASAGKLLGALWELRGEKRVEDVDSVKRLMAALKAGVDVAGPSDDELRTTYAIAHPEPRPILTCMSDVEAREIAWLWQDRIPLGRITLLCGRPGEGKSFCSLDIAARVTTGRDFPDGTPCPRGSVLLISGEDDPGDTIRPRLDASGADVSRIQLLSGVKWRTEEGEQREVMFTLSHIKELGKALRKMGDCRLIVVDPVGSYIGGKADTDKDNAVRAILSPLAALADNFGAAMLLVAHRRKSSGDFADDTALGSRAFTGIARAVWHISRDKDNRDRRLFLAGKNNLSRAGNGLAFTIEGTPPAVTWERDPVCMSADEGLAAESLDRERPGPEPVVKLGAMDWLSKLLGDGPMEASEVKKAATEAGWKWRTVQVAAEELQLDRHKAGFGRGWTWNLRAPAEGAAKAQ